MRHLVTVLAASLTVFGCDGAKERECAELRALCTERRPQFEHSPERSDRSLPAQARDWQWRAERAREAADLFASQRFEDPALDTIRSDIHERYRVLEQIASMCTTMDRQSTMNNCGTHFLAVGNFLDTLERRIDTKCGER